MAGWQIRAIGKGKSAFRDGLAYVTDTILPPLNDADLFDQLTFLDEPCCASCGYPFEHQISGLAAFDLQCAACLARRPVYATARSAFQYDDASKRMILAFKHGGKTDRLSYFAAQMHRAGRQALADADCLIPVPLHRMRLIKRRFNQSTLLANTLSKRSGVPVEPHALRRIKATPTQNGLTAKGRRRNVQGAFRVSDPSAVANKRLVLIDDVMTTGATLEACTRALKQAGAARVDAVCLARVVRPRSE